MLTPSIAANAPLRIRYTPWERSVLSAVLFYKVGKENGNKLMNCNDPARVTSNAELNFLKSGDCTTVRFLFGFFPRQ